jgi:organic hydroperoxide reductase OsmC/OhrA
VIHRYRATCDWAGTTAVGYEHYERTHDLVCAPAELSLRLSSDPAFRGDPRLLNPEQLLLAAASSCQLLSFLSVAARARIDVRGYRDAAEAEMAEDVKPMRISTIRLRPEITVVPETDEARVHELVAFAHQECFIANSVSCAMDVRATVRCV